MLGSVCSADGRFGLAWLDLSAGRFTVMELDGADALEAEIERLRPAEMLAPDGALPVGRAHRASAPGGRGRPGISTPTQPPARSRNSSAPATWRASAARTSRLAVAAAGALLHYVRETQKAALPHLRALSHRGAATAP